MSACLARWFLGAMLSAALPLCAAPPDLRQNLRIELPSEARPFPEPLPPGAEPGFPLRGTKGWAWTPEQYLAEIPYLVKFRMNFLMICYLSLFDLEHFPDWTGKESNRWWEDLPEAKKAAYEEVVRACQRNDIQFCFGMNPNLMSKRLANDGRPDSIDLLWKHYAWMQGLGVKWFNLSLDDATEGIHAASQAKVANEIFRRLRAHDPGAQFIFCPTYYWGDGTDKDARPYLEELARELDKDIHVFWTGDEVVGKVTRVAAESYRRIAAHRLILWDNFPVTDDHATMHLGPVIDRAPDLPDIVDGYIANPHRRQNQINRIPLATCADYAYNPRAYDPNRSIGQAVFLLGATPQERQLLAELVETYAGFLTYGKYRPDYNAVRETYLALEQVPHSRLAAQSYIEHLRRLADRLARTFPDSYGPEKQTLAEDIRQLSEWHSAKYGAAPEPSR